MADSQTQNKLHFTVFQTLLLISYVFHQTESWDHRWLAVVSVGVLFLFAKTPLQQIIFWTASLLYVVIYFEKFPNLANHSNLSFFIFLLVLPMAWKTSLWLSDKNYPHFLKTMRWVAVITYFFAAFHKLNSDFFNIEVSCANDKMGEYLDLLPDQWESFKLVFRQWLPFLGFITEAVIPVSLLIPRLRYFGIVFQCGLHFLLAPLGFIDFSSLAMGLSWSFVNPKSLDALLLKKHLKQIVTAVLLLTIGLGLFRWGNQQEEFEFFEGMAFTAIFISLIWFHVLPKLDRSALRLPTSLAHILFIALLFIYGASNYLGLRTAGTFSMFSNLQTEGATSNHLLLSSNPFKIFSFQEDLVEVVSVDERYQGYYRKMPYPEQLIPRVEFSRLMDIFKQRRGPPIAMEVIYQNKTLKTQDLANDAQFNFDVPTWQKKLFKFRGIQKQGPQKCAW